MMNLRRSLSLPQLVLYGIGTTIGAGIYALVGEISAVAGWLSPWSFLVASAMAALTALSFAELSSRFPRAAGAALYVEQGFGSQHLAMLVGCLVIACGVVSSAALMNGFAGYLTDFVRLGDAFVMTLGVIVLCGLAIWGIKQSAWAAAMISVVEVGGLIWVTTLSLGATELRSADWSRFLPSSSDALPILSGAILSFYAYIGFEDMVEVAEEVRDVRRTLPRAILITLVTTSVVYVVLLGSMLLAVGPEAIAASSAPLAYVHQLLTGSRSNVLGVIALFAIINGALIQIIMASRVIYGLASRGQLPAVLGRVSARWQTPALATLIVSAGVLTLALTGQLAGLAEATSLLMLLVFCLINLALWRVQGRAPAPEGAFKVPRFVPPIAFVVCAFFVVHGFSQWAMS